MTHIYFRVNNKIIFNDILAKYESYVSKQPIEFICHDQAYDQLDWTQEPSQSFDQLMDLHAINLRNRYERVVLSWSGGTDSHTIYNVFKRNNLHIDEIVVWVNDKYEPWNTVKYVEWLKNNHHDPLTKITTRERFDPVAKEKIVNNEDWLFQNISLIPKFVMGTTDSVMWDYCADQYSDTTWCLITGHEQPKVFLQDKKYYACHDSRMFLSVMNFENLECFYTEPLLALKQAHMIKKMIKHLNKANKFTQDTSDTYKNHLEQHMRFNTDQSYTAWARSLGRHKEVIQGVSWFHKRAEYKFDLQPVTPDAIDGELSRGWDLALADTLKQDQTVAKLFERGIKNLLLEKDFCDHLMQTSDDSKKSVLGKSTGRPTYSKAYDLGE